MHTQLSLTAGAVHPSLALLPSSQLQLTPVLQALLHPRTAAAPDSQNAQGFYRKNFNPLSECAVGPTKLKPMLAALKAAKLPPRRKSLLDVGWPRPPLRAKPPRKG
jgi:hypothetical protein